MRFKAQLLSRWESVRTSYWFVPSVMALGAILLGFLTLILDRTLWEGWIKAERWLYRSSPEGARSLLSTIAASMIGLAGVVFSITIVALVLASNQFGPRLLRNFMRDLTNQIVLGTFVANFIYCLLVLRSVHGTSDTPANEFVPQVSVMVAMALAIGGLGVLILFIHHVAKSIQAPMVIAAVSADLLDGIDELYPERIGEGRGDREQTEADSRRQVPERFEAESVGICAGKAGYVQRIQPEQLMQEAMENDLIVRIEREPGRFVDSDEFIIRAWPGKRVNGAIKHRLRRTFTINQQRTLTQDAEFAVDQLVEIALRALSPSLNDPFTAMQCIDRLSVGLSQLVERELPTAYRLDDSGRLRVIAEPHGFAHFVGAAFNQIRQNSQRSLAVMVRLLRAIAHIGRHVHDARDRACLAEHAKLVYEQAGNASSAMIDRRSVEQHYEEAKKALGPG